MRRRRKALKTRSLAWLVLLCLGACGDTQISSALPTSAFDRCSADCLPVILGVRGNGKKQSEYFVELRPSSPIDPKTGISNIAVYGRILGRSADGERVRIDLDHQFMFHESMGLFLGMLYSPEFGLGDEIEMDRLARPVPAASHLN